MIQFFIIIKHSCHNFCAATFLLLQMWFRAALTPMEQFIQYSGKPPNCHVKYWNRTVTCYCGVNIFIQCQGRRWVRLCWAKTVLCCCPEYCFNPHFFVQLNLLRNCSCSINRWPLTSLLELQLLSRGQWLTSCIPSWKCLRVHMEVMRPYPVVLSLVINFFNCSFPFIFSM